VFHSQAIHHRFPQRAVRQICGEKPRYKASVKSCSQTLGTHDWVYAHPYLGILMLLKNKLIDGMGTM